MAFARCGMFTTKPGGMGGYSEYAFGRVGHFMANYAYSVSIVIANVAIAITAVGYGAGFLETTFTPLQTCLYTIALLWIAAALNFSGSRYSGKLSTITIWGAIIGPGHFHHRLALVQRLPGWLRGTPITWDSAMPSAIPIALTLWSFLGLESAAVNMDAVENPKKSVPIATFVSTLASPSSTSPRRTSLQASSPMRKSWHRALPSAWPSRTCSAYGRQSRHGPDGILLCRFPLVLAVHPGPRLQDQRPARPVPQDFRQSHQR